MTREQHLTAIILKKQPYLDADEIITLYTKELGKVRCLAKSVKSPKSKLQQKLQAQFLVDVILTSGKLPKIISVETASTFFGLRENLAALKAAFYAVELVLKFTPDEQPNESLFNLLEDFLEFLNKQNPESLMALGLAKFKMEMLEVSGFAINIPESLDKGLPVFFNLEKGGFVSFSGLPVTPQAYQCFLNLRQVQFENLGKIGSGGGVEELQQLLSEIIEYHLEREVKSEKYLKA